MINVIDLFAGPGGWDEGLALLGRRDVLGVEWDADACASAEAAGHLRLRADISTLEPREFEGWAEGLIASPPCTGFSVAGRSRGLGDLSTLVDAVIAIAGGASPVEATRATPMADPRSLLVLEPLRWATALTPAWIACEQVPALLPLWQASARILQGRGYFTWTGIINAEQYGVPQTRERAILLASLEGPILLPAITHSRYHRRDPTRRDPGTQPWRTMRDTLGWDADDLIGFPRLYDARDDGIVLGGVAYRLRDLRTADQPSWTLTARSMSWWRWPVTGGAVRVSVAEGAQLQTFRPDYPWQGSRTSAYRQLANAVPPLLGATLLSALPAPHLIRSAA